MSSEQLSKGFPSQATIARAEFNLAIASLMKVLHDMKEDGVAEVGMMTDHGHRAGQDHFVVLFVWAGKDENGEMTLKSFCPSIDKAGHSTEAAAKGVQSVVQRFLGDEVAVFTILGDAGGGGAVQHLHPKLIEMEVMAESSKLANCSLHGMQKAVENASKNTMGDQGMGNRCPAQLVNVFSSLMAKLREEGGPSCVDTVWVIVQNELQSNSDWEEDAKRCHLQAWQKLRGKIDSFDETSDDDVNSLTKFMTEAPRDVQEPVWTRWQTMIKTTKILLDNWMSVYFLAVAVKGQSRRSKSSYWPPV